MANPERHIVLGEKEAHAVAARYIALEAELQAMRLHNKELVCTLQEQENIVVTERLRVNRRSRAQTQEFANLTAELLTGR